MKQSEITIKSLNAHPFKQLGVMVLVFNATFNNIFISWPSVLLVVETGENHRPVASRWQILSQCYIEYTSP
jgi:hypothetical protein